MKLAKLALVLTYCAAGGGMAVCASGCGGSGPPAPTTQEAYMANLPDEVRADEEKFAKRVQEGPVKPKAKHGAGARKH